MVQCNKKYLIREGNYADHLPSVPTGETFKLLNVNQGIKCKFDLIMKTSITEAKGLFLIFKALEPFLLGN